MWDVLPGERRWRSIEDFILIQKIQSGDTEAFDFLVRKYYRAVYRFSYFRLNGDADTAADITQEVFLKVLENIHAVRGIGKFQNYLLTIAANLCNNDFKKAKPIYTDLTAFEIADETSPALEKVIREESAEEVRRAIASLPDCQKEAVILRFYHDLKIREIAKITNANVSTVKSRLQQGLKKLRKSIESSEGSGNV